jgi:two-component system OmpR family response regulator
MNTILVVDDSPFIVDVFINMLERGGYRAIASYSGQECLDILKEVTPDLILLDIMMEPMDGWETLEHIKNNPDTKDIPVLMLTAKQLTSEEAQEYGMYIEDYVLKPITHRELYDTIEHVIQRRTNINVDVEEAKKAGFDQRMIEEYARLSKSVDVNKRLLKILETTYNIHDSKVALSEKISNAIKSMGTSIKFQEERLQHIRGELSKAMETKEPSGQK